MADLKSIPGGKAPRPRRSTATPAPPRKLTTLQALTRGTPLEKLEAQRDLAAKRLADTKTSARDFGSILKQFGDLEEKIATFGSEGKTPEERAAHEPIGDEKWNADDA